MGFKKEILEYIEQAKLRKSGPDFISSRVPFLFARKTGDSTHTDILYFGLGIPAQTTVYNSQSAHNADRFFPTQFRILERREATEEEVLLLIQEEALRFVEQKGSFGDFSSRRDREKLGLLKGLVEENNTRLVNEGQLESEQDSVKEKLTQVRNTIRELEKEGLSSL